MVILLEAVMDIDLYHVRPVTHPWMSSLSLRPASSGGYLPIYGHAVDVPGSLIVMAAALRAGCRPGGSLRGVEADEPESGFPGVAEQPFATHESWLPLRPSGHILAEMT
jgi:hypothetical protein